MMTNRRNQLKWKSTDWRNTQL